MRKFEEWIIAYRIRKEGQTLIEDQVSPFNLIPNTWRYWCADPQMLEYHGQTYVFAELYDRILRRGVIGYCQLGERGCTHWRVVLKMPWHLSYPYLVKYNDSVYMIPESYAGKEISVYKAVCFPDRWEKVHTFCSDCVAVDSTVFCMCDNWWMQTLRIEEGHSRLELYRINEKHGNLEACRILEGDPDNIRSAGPLFMHNNRLIRPAQDCTESYGYALNFYEITDFSTSTYEEKLIAKIFPASICSELREGPHGIHTYGVNSKYEIIDLKQYTTDLLAYIMRPAWFLWRRLKKVFWR